MKKEIIKLKIQSDADRVNIVTALANSGYKVWAGEEEGEDYWKTDYYICFELKQP